MKPSPSEMKLSFSDQPSLKMMDEDTTLYTINVYYILFLILII